MKLIILGLGAVFSMAVSAQTSPGARRDGRVAPPAKATIESVGSFRENRGQWDARAKFLSQTKGLDYWVTSTGAVLDFYTNKGLGDKAKRIGHVVEMKVRNSTPAAAQPVGYGVRPGKMDYFVGSRQARGVQNFAEAAVRQVAPGVNFRHYIDQGTVRYDIVVLPGGDARNLTLDFTGAHGVSVRPDGTLSIKTSIGDIAYANLKAYQPVGANNRGVACRFVARDSKSVSFELGNYDPRLPLVIDPLVFGSYAGANYSNPLVPATSDEETNGVAASDTGDVFLTGKTSSATFPINAGPYDKYSIDGLDCFLMKMDGDAYSVSYAAVLGGSDTDIGVSAGFSDAAGILWIMGASDSNDFAGQNNAKGSNTRLFVSKFTFVGDTVTPQFVRWVNDAGEVGELKAFDFGAVPPPGLGEPPRHFPLKGRKLLDMVVSTSGSAFLGGTGDSGDLTGAGFTNYLPNAVSGDAAWIIKLDANGDPEYKTMIGAQVDCSFGGLAVDASDRVVVTGSVEFSGIEDTAVAANPTFITTPGVFDGVPGVFQGGRWLQNVSAYLVQLEDSGAGRWAAILGGSNTDRAVAVSYDPRGNIYVLGRTNSFNFQRTPGVYDQDFQAGKMFVTKLPNDATAIVYSTGLRDAGNVIPTSIVADERGVAAVGGILSFSNVSGGLWDYQESIPGTIQQTADAISGDYEGGDRQVNKENAGESPSDFPSTRDAFVTFLNSSGTNLLYSDNIGTLSDEVVNDLAVDRVGAVYVGGTTQMVWSRGLLTLTQIIPPTPVNPHGIEPYITGNAFKLHDWQGIPLTGPIPPDNDDPMQGPLFWGIPDFAASNGYLVKLRVNLPVLSSVSFNPGAVAGGLGASSTATISLRDPAPPGGVTMQAQLSNINATSFTGNPGDVLTTFVIPEGQQTITLDVFTLPVTEQQNSDLRVTLDNDYIVARLSIAPWLNNFSLLPGTTDGGKQVSARVVLFQPAPVGGVSVALSTNRSDIIKLPTVPEIVVPEGATVANILLDTLGVDTQQSGNVSASLLGVVKTSQLILNPSKIVSLVFSPDKLNRGENTTGTVIFNGKTGSQRNVTISYVSGPTGALVDGQPLPVVIVIPSQSDKGTFTLTAPTVTQQSLLRVKADDGTSNALGQVTIDAIDIADIELSPGADVLGGTLINGRVTLTNPAGPNGFDVNISNTNSNAGTLLETVVTVPPGQTVSSSFRFQTKIVGSDTFTNLHATKPGFVGKYKSVAVRGIQMSLTLTPTTVVGGAQNSTGNITISKPAPLGGITFNMSSSDTLAATVPTQVTIQEGQTSQSFTVTSKRTPVVRTTTITATGSATVKASKVLTVNPPAITGLTISPNPVLGGNITYGTITFSTQCPTGTVVNLSATPSGVVTIPSSVTVTAGLTSFKFVIKTNAVALTTGVTIKATLGPTSKSAALTVRAPGLTGITFTPSRVVGGSNALGRVTLDGPAPPGGITVTVTSGNTAYAKVSGSGLITIPGGQFSGTFTVTTSRVSRTVGVQFSATSSLGTTTGTLFIDP